MASKNSYNKKDAGPVEVFKVQKTLAGTYIAQSVNHPMLATQDKTIGGLKLKCMALFERMNEMNAKIAETGAFDFYEIDDITKNLILQVNPKL